VLSPSVKVLCVGGEALAEVLDGLGVIVEEYDGLT